MVNHTYVVDIPGFWPFSTPAVKRVNGMPLVPVSKLYLNHDQEVTYLVTDFQEPVFVSSV